jgi:hypothetical protein
MLDEYELCYSSDRTVEKNVWIKLHVTEVLNRFAGSTHSIIDVLYVNKYNYGVFAIKRLESGYRINRVYLSGDVVRFEMDHKCNYFSASHFMHLPDNAIRQITVGTHSTT